MIAALGAILVPMTAAAEPQTRKGFFMGIGLARGSMTVENSPSEGGWGGGFRLGYGINEKVGLGLECDRFVEVSQGSAITLGTLAAAVSVYPAEGLVLRAGAGLGDVAGGGGGLSGEVGTGWMVGAAYEFRVGRTLAIGPQIAYNGVNLQYADANFLNVGVGMTWYFTAQ